jgi:hypothetical protein
MAILSSFSKFCVKKETYKMTETEKPRVEAQRLKAAWEVRGGLIPDSPMPEYTKQFLYTSADMEYDQTTNAALSPAYHSKLAKVRAEAIDYYLQVSNPSMLNWAEITFIWY